MYLTFMQSSWDLLALSQSDKPLSFSNTFSQATAKQHKKLFSLISLHNIAYHIIAILHFLYFVNSKFCQQKSCIKFINQTRWCNNEHRIGFIENCALLHDFSLVHMRYTSGERILSIDQSAPQDNGVNWMRVPFGERFSSSSETTPEFFFNFVETTTQPWWPENPLCF